MFTKTKNISKNIPIFFRKKMPLRIVHRKQQLKFERNPRKGKDIIATRTDDDDGRRTNFDFMNSADIVEHM